MSNEIQEIVSTFAQVKSEIKAAIRDLPQESLNWTPVAGEANSIYAIVTHICGSERQWMQGTIGGQAVQRDRDAEFVARGQKVDDLIALLDKTQEETASVLSKETVESLGRIVQRYPDRPKTTALASVVGCLRHVSEHLGHAQLTKQLWENRE